MKRRVVSVLMAAAISMGLCACGSSGGDSTGSNASETSQSQESTAGTGEVVEVDFWSAPNVDQYNFWTKKANEFNEAGIELDGKKIEVKVQQMPESPSSEAGILLRWQNQRRSMIFRMRTGIKRLSRTV